MAAPSRYDVAIYDDPNSIYEQAWVVYTEEDDTLSSNAYSSKTGDIEYTEGDDTLSSNSNLLIVGSSTYLEEDDTLSSNSKLFIAGITSYTQEDDTFIGQATAPIMAVLIYTSDNDTISSYIVKSPWGSTSSNADNPYTSTTGINPNPPFQVTSGYYGNQRPYEEN